MIMAVHCQSANVDVSASAQQKAMVDPEVERERQRDEVVKKAATCSLLGCDLDDSMSEYEEDMEPLLDEESLKELVVVVDQGRRNNNSNRDNNNTKEMEEMDNFPRPPRSPRRTASTGKRNKLRRSLSLDGSMDGSKRHSWDGSNRIRKGKPDFRWDKFKGGSEEFRWDKFREDLDDDSHCRSSATSSSPPPPQPTPTTTKKAVDSPTATKPAITASPRPHIGSRRKPPRRTKSLDFRNNGAEKSRPIIQRTNSRVRFCMESEIFEVPRPTKDMKPDLFYTKKEIKVFKAEKKEEKRELKQQKKLEKLKAAARASSEERDSSSSSSNTKAFETMGSTPIATC